MKRINKFVSRLVHNDRFVMVVSLVISFAIWFSFAQSDDPIISRTVSNVPVNITLNDTALSGMGLEVITDTDLTANVRISGKASSIYSISAADMTVTPNVTAVSSAGEYEVRLTASKNSAFAGFDIDAVEPETMKLRFDSIVTRTFPVTAKALGASAPDGLVAENAVIADQANATIELTGPATEINSISSVVAQADVNKELKSTETMSADIVLLDTDGQEISTRYITMSFAKADITVSISRMKDVPLVATFIGAPSANPVKAELDIKTTTVIGPPDIIDELKSIELTPIDMSEVTESGTYECGVVLPTSVRSYDGVDKVNVKLTVSGCTSKSVTVSGFSASNVPLGLKASLSKSVTVTLMGKSSQIRSLTADDITINVDMSNYSKAGDYTVSATVSVKGHDAVWVIGGDYTAAVTLK
ncbi:MAG: CdaR family protein [Firmicutes bacterium]|nr:CdaR family protein [Bacillota bacterium]